MTKDKFKKGARWSLAAIACFVLLIAVNLASLKWFHRFDLTTNHLYSLSDFSRRTTQHLPVEVTVKAYLSRDLPPEYAAVREQVLDVLNEYASYNSKFKIELADVSDAAVVEKAGIPKLQFNDVRKDKIEVVNGYLGLVIESGDKKEVIPVIDNVSALEYRLTTAVRKLTSKDSLSVGLLTSHGSADKSMATALAEIAKIYEVKKIDLAKNAKLTDIKTLIIAGPREKFTDKELKILDDFIAGGGSLLVMIDPVGVGQNMLPEINKTNLAQWLATYNVKVGQELVLDISAGLASFNQGIVSYSLPYAFWPKVLNANMNETSPMVSRLDGIVLPWAVSVDYVGTSSKDLEVTKLMSTTKRAWLSAVSQPLSPDKIPAAKNVGQYNLALELSGSLLSQKASSTANGNGRLIVIGDADFARDDFLVNNPANIALFSNLVDGISLDEGLMSIRAKLITDHPLAEASEATRQWYRYLNVFGLPLLILLAGGVYYYFRYRTKNIQF